MGSGTLAVLAAWLAGVAVICRAEPFGSPAVGGAVALAAAALFGLLG